MTTYELTYIISPEITSEEAEAKGKEIESLIQNKEGVVVRQNNPIAKTLSYPIKKQASGFFGVFEFQLEPEKLSEIKDVIVKDGKIVRHMVIIKRAQRPRKERRAKAKPAVSSETEPKTEFEAAIDEKLVSRPKPSDTKGKVEFKDIEQQLDELLG